MLNSISKRTEVAVNEGRCGLTTGRRRRRTLSEGEGCLSKALKILWAGGGVPPWGGGGGGGGGEKKHRQLDGTWGRFESRQDPTWE